MGSNFRLGTPGQATRLAWFSTEGDNNLFPQAVVIDADGNLFATVDLTNITIVGVIGGYEGNFTPSEEKEYNVYYTIYATEPHRAAQTPALMQGDFETVKAERFPGVAWTWDNISVEEIENILKPVLEQIKFLEEEINRRPVFNPKTDIVKTDIKQLDTKKLIADLNKIVVVNKSNIISIVLFFFFI